MWVLLQYTFHSSISPKYLVYFPGHHLERVSSSISLSAVSVPSRGISQSAFLISGFAHRSTRLLPGFGNSLQMYFPHLGTQDSFLSWVVSCGSSWELEFHRSSAACAAFQQLCLSSQSPEQAGEGVQRKGAQSSEQAGEGAQSSEQGGEDAQSSEQEEKGSQSSEQAREGAQSSEQAGEGAQSPHQGGEGAQSREQAEKGSQSSEQAGDGAQSSEQAGEGAQTKIPGVFSWNQEPGAS
uniref:Uncharacterized protein n=1 Tax=Zosterops lateralis melanops TaxID=1220523 RepID=A0A8D2QMG2_ZOSLA